MTSDKLASEERNKEIEFVFWIDYSAFLIIWTV